MLIVPPLVIEASASPPLLASTCCWIPEVTPAEATAGPPFAVALAPMLMVPPAALLRLAEALPVPDFATTCCAIPPSTLAAAVALPRMATGVAPVVMPIPVALAIALILIVPAFVRFAAAFAPDLPVAYWWMPSLIDAFA